LSYPLYDKAAEWPPREATKSLVIKT